MSDAVWMYYGRIETLQHDAVQEDCSLQVKVCDMFAASEQPSIPRDSRFGLERSKVRFDS